MGDKKLYLEAKLENIVLQTREYYTPKLCRQLLVNICLVSTLIIHLMFESKYQNGHQDSKKGRKVLKILIRVRSLRE